MSKEDEVRKQIADAVALAKSLGAEIAHTWGITYYNYEKRWRAEDPTKPCLCPLSCVILARLPGRPGCAGGCGDAPWVAHLILGIEETDVTAFINGFDNINSDIRKVSDNPYYAMGVSFQGVAA